MVQGHQYSLLTWTPQVRQSWSLTLSNRRLTPEQNVIAVGVEQIKALSQARPDPLEKKLDVIVADGHYGNHHFLGPLKSLPCAALARLRKDRVLYGPPPPYKGHGRPNVHGKRFAFKEPDTWPEPDEAAEITHPRWGTVRLRRWNKLHAKQDAQTDFTVIRANVHLERDTPPPPLWLGYVPGHTDQPVAVVWGWFDYRCRLNRVSVSVNSPCIGPCPAFRRVKRVTAGPIWLTSPFGSFFSPAHWCRIAPYLGRKRRLT